MTIARTVPERATTTKAARAMLEYRLTTAAISALGRNGRTTSSRRRPPNHTAGGDHVRISAVTAVSWFDSSPECPSVPKGMSVATARMATISVGVQERTANVSTVRTEPRSTVMSQA